LLLLKETQTKLQLLLEGEETVMALRQALELQAQFPAARHRKMSTGTFWESHSPLMSEKTTDNLHAGAVGSPAIFEETAPMK
jgi:hypothetical protein